TGLNDDMRIARTEIFGPVFPFYRFSTEDEVVRRANQTEYGLVAYAYTRDVGRALRLARDIEAGMVILNSGSVGTASVPFGGVKQSGYGREGSHHGIEEYVDVRYVQAAAQEVSRRRAGIRRYSTRVCDLAPLIRSMAHRDLLPPLNPARAFEATGRLLSITKAADELCVTPAAVSRQVRALEQFLGTALFVRARGGLELTPA